MTPNDAKNCARKVHFPTKEEAARIIRDFPRAYAGCHAYPCPCGQGWLVGHKVGARRKLRRRMMEARP